MAKQSNIEGWKYKGAYYAAWELEFQDIIADLHACNSILDECMRNERIEALEKEMKRFSIK